MCFSAEDILPAQNESFIQKNSNTKSYSTFRFKASASASASAADVPEFLYVDWLESRRKRPFGPRLSFNAEECVQYQLDALMFNDQPRPDYGVEVSLNHKERKILSTLNVEERVWIRGARPEEEETFQFTMSWWILGWLLDYRICSS